MASFLQFLTKLLLFLNSQKFSSLSESGFIPTNSQSKKWYPKSGKVLISFREWLHSYATSALCIVCNQTQSSHLFQRVASFLHKNQIMSLIHGVFDVLISFREWLHSYVIMESEIGDTLEHCSHLFQRVASFLLGFRLRPETGVIELFSSLSESGFIPTFSNWLMNWKQSIIVLISFREWLHSYSTDQP